jgi:hypothetical protein
VVEIASGAVEELIEGLAAMVAGDVGVEVLPDALDAVGVRAIGRQKVQHDMTAEGVEGFTGETGGVDAVVVYDEVHAARVSVTAEEQHEQLAEERGVLAGGAGGTRRLLTFVSLTSLFTAGQLLIWGNSRSTEVAAIVSAFQAAAEEALGKERVAQAEWRALLNGGDLVGLALFISEALAPDWDKGDAIARAFVIAAMEGLVMVSVASATQSSCNLASSHLRAGNKRQALELALGVMHADPLSIDAHFAMVPLLVQAGLPRADVSGIVETLAATYSIDAQTQPMLDAARAACAPRAGDTDRQPGGQCSGDPETSSVSA